MKILIIQENGRNEANRHMRECHSLAYWFSKSGAETACWGKGHDTFKTSYKEFEKDFDIVFCMFSLKPEHIWQLSYKTPCLIKSISTIIQLNPEIVK